MLLVLHSRSLVVDSFNQLPGESNLSCTDDSDCIPLGHKFGCFLYRFNSITHEWFLTNHPSSPDASTMLTPVSHAVNSPALALSVGKVGIGSKLHQKREFIILFLARRKLLPAPTSERRRFVLSGKPPAALLLHQLHFVLHHLHLHLHLRGSSCS